MWELKVSRKVKPEQYETSEGFFRKECTMDGHSVLVGEGQKYMVLHTNCSEDGNVRSFCVVETI